MKKGIILVRPMGQVSEVENTIEKKIVACGRNTGNIVWYESTKESIKYDYELILYEKLKEICKEYDETIYVCPMANHICMFSSGLEEVARIFLNKESDRVVLIGLGAQLTQEANTPRKLMNTLPKERIRALRELGEHSVSIGIRGEITAECLDVIGVHNYKVIGCPSFYSNQEAIYEVCDKNSGMNGRVNINISAYGHAGISRFLNILIAEGKLKDSTYIMQMMDDFPKTIYENTPILERHMKERFPQVNISAEDFTKYVRNNGKIFFNKDEWISFLKNKDISLSIGARFHGNMMSLLAGIPSIWITHDSRTTELCRAMGLPHIDIDTMNKLHCWDDILSYNNYNEEFKHSYKKKLDNYLEFLKDNGLTYIK